MWDVAIVEALVKPYLSVEEIFSTPPENKKRYIVSFHRLRSSKWKKYFGRSWMGLC